MKTFFITVSLLILGGIMCSFPPATADDSNSASKQASLYAIPDVVSLEGAPLSSFAGSVALVVNTASNCGFTYQLGGLQSLFEQYREQGFTVLAFPSNDFAGQEPGSNEEIAAFCEGTYQTEFPIFPKASVTGETKQVVFSFLTEQSAEEFAGDPGWNFVKFLVNRSGQVVGRFSSVTSPTSDKIRKAIEQELAKPTP